ncbi:MAG: adenylate/guanylate cyclase domain-containing protein [Chitinophagaceae bacterium]
MSQSRQLAAIMFTDIVGYTALMGDDEQKAFELLNKNRQLQKPIIEQYGGRWIKELGDGVMASFATATDAVQCAISIQRACNSIPGLQLRIGIHLGDVMFEENDVFGDGVNIASRLQAIASPGAIYISESVHNNIANKKEINTKYVRAETLKNVKEPVRIYEVSSGDANTLHSRKRKSYKSSPKRKTIIFGSIGLFLLLVLLGYYFIINKNNGNDKKLLENSIAVLYFDNMSGDSTQEYFSDGMTEEITARLSKIAGLKVKSRTSVLQYKNQVKTAKLIAQELGVSNILEGSVRRQGDKVAITAQLINGETDEHIWSETYNREMKDIFEVQSDIAQQIANKFQIKLSVSNQKKLVTPPTLNMEAYDKYLNASSLSFLDVGLGGKHPNTQKAILLLKQAIQLDPGFADALALLSLNYSYYSGVVDHPQRLLDSALILARKAIELNPEREQGYIAIARVKQSQGHFDEALKWLLKAHEIVPFSTAGSIAHTYLGKNDYASAFEWVMKAKQYDPTATANYMNTESSLYFNLGLLDSMKNSVYNARNIKSESREIDEAAMTYFFFTGNEEEYIRVVKKMVTQDEKELTYRLGQFYFFQRKWKVADSFFLISSKPDDMDAGLIKIQLGNKELGKKYLNEAIKRRLHFMGFDNEWHYYDISRCYAAMQDNRYNEYLNKAIQRGWHEYTWFEHDPFFDLVRDTPEFKKLRQKIYERNEGFKADLYAAIKRYEN